MLDWRPQEVWWLPERFCQEQTRYPSRMRPRTRQRSRLRGDSSGWGGSWWTSWDGTEPPSSCSCPCGSCCHSSWQSPTLSWTEASADLLPQKLAPEVRYSTSIFWQMAYTWLTSFLPHLRTNSRVVLETKMVKGYHHDDVTLHYMRISAFHIADGPEDICSAPSCKRTWDATWEDDTVLHYSSSFFYLKMYKISPSGWILINKLGMVTNWKSPSLALGKKTSGFHIACTNFGSAKSRGSWKEKNLVDIILQEKVIFEESNHKPLRIPRPDVDPSTSGWDRCQLCSPR